MMDKFLLLFYHLERIKAILFEKKAHVVDETVKKRYNKEKGMVWKWKEKSRLVGFTAILKERFTAFSPWQSTRKRGKRS